MILPCEVGVKTVLPAVKAVMARRIVEKHGLNEQKTAELQGLSQSAVSRYRSKQRGNNLAIENSAEILALIDQMVTFLIKEPEKKGEFMDLFCQTCRAIRKDGLMCAFCQKEIPGQWTKNCVFCRY